MSEHTPPEEVVEALFTDTHEYEYVQRREMRQLLTRLHAEGLISYPTAHPPREQCPTHREG